MWLQFTDAERAALRRTHTAPSRVDILHAGRRVHTLLMVSGLVTVDAARAVRSNLDCQLIDPTGALSRGDVDDLLNAYECEVAPWRGVRLAGRDTLAPWGVYQLADHAVRDTPDGLTITLAGQDRAIGYQGEMDSAVPIPAGTPVETAIQRLLAKVNPAVTVAGLRSGFTVGPLLFRPDINVWDEARELAASVGAELFHDRTGQCVLTLAGPASDTPVAQFAEGDGLLQQAERAEDSDTIRNVVVVESVDGRFVAVAEDTNPTSPTYARGPRSRRRVRTIRNQHIGSLQQAQQAATVRLAYELGRSETVTFTAVPDPALDVDEVVTVHRPRAGLTHRALVVESIAMPLSAEELMTVSCRRSVLTPDGQVLPVGEVAA